MSVSREQLRRRFWLAAPAVGAALILAFPRSGPERLARISTREALIAVRDEKAYIRAASPSADILETSIRGGNRRPVAALTGWLSPGESTIRATFEDSRVLFEWPRLGAGITAEPPEESEAHTTGIPKRRRGIRAWITAASLEGGPSYPLLPELWMDRTAILGRQCYWFQSDPNSQPPSQPPNRPSPQDPLRSPPPRDLMVTPLGGGPTRRLVTGLPSTTRLVAGENHVFWMDTSLPPGSRDLFLSQPGSERIERLRGYTGTEPPFLFEDRFYWLSETTETLVSAELDGSDERELLSNGLRTEVSSQRRLLGVHQGWLYLTELRPRSERSGVFSSPALGLYRIWLAQPKAVERLVSLPFESSGYCFDGDFFYFTASAQQETWLDWSPQGLNLKTDQFLYRYRLPH